MRPRAERGFTLIEMLIVVAIVGILAGIAVPSFRNYQNTSKRAEAYTNLSALVSAQKAYFAEYGAYIGVPLSEPGWGLGNVAPGPKKRDVSTLTAAFGSLGFTPDGEVFYDYDTSSTGTANAGAGGDDPNCTCAKCFTASAYGDVDGDGLPAVIAYFAPDESGVTCKTATWNYTPPIGPSGSMVDEIVRIPGPADDY